jgi:hypothetical protein
MGWHSSSQLPFLINNANNAPIEQNTNVMIKKKPQIVIQKTNNTSGVSQRTYGHQNFTKK